MNCGFSSNDSVGGNDSLGLNDSPRGSNLHIAPVLPAHLKQGVGDLPQ